MKKMKLNVLWMLMVLVILLLPSSSFGQTVKNIECVGTYQGMPWQVDGEDCSLKLKCNGGATKNIPGKANTAKTKYVLGIDDLRSACGCGIYAICCYSGQGCYCENYWKANLEQPWPGCSEKAAEALRKWEVENVCTEGREYETDLVIPEGFHISNDHCCPEGREWKRGKCRDEQVIAPDYGEPESCTYQDGIFCDYGDAASSWIDWIGLIPGVDCGDKNGFRGRSCTEELQYKWLNTKFMKGVFGFTDSIINAETKICEATGGFNRFLGGILKPIETHEDDGWAFSFSAKKTNITVGSEAPFYTYETSWVMTTGEYPVAFKIIMAGPGGVQYAIEEFGSVGENTADERSYELTLEQSYSRVCYEFENDIVLNDGTSAGKLFCRNFQ